MIKLVEIVQPKEPKKPRNRHSEIFDHGVDALAEAVIKQAADDWRTLYRKDAKSGSFAPLRRFFNSSWCAMLCMDADPRYILRHLERERREWKEMKAEENNV